MLALSLFLLPPMPFDQVPFLYEIFAHTECTLEPDGSEQCLIYDEYGLTFCVAENQDAEFVCIDVE